MRDLAAATRDAAARWALVACAAGAAASAACTNDYDAFGDGTSAAAGGAGGATTVTTGAGAGTGHAGGGGQGGGGQGGGGQGGAGGAGGDQGGGGAASLPGDAPCEGLSLDFAFDVDTALPDPWTQSIAGQADLATADGDLLVTFAGPGRDRGALLAPAPDFADCSVTVVVPEPPRWTGVENAVAAAFVAAASDGDDAPALALLFGVDATGTATATYVGAVDLPVTGAPLAWALGPLAIDGVRLLRLRATGGSLFYDVSSDGAVWETLGDLAISPDAVRVGAWKDGTLQTDEGVTVVLGAVNP